MINYNMPLQRLVRKIENEGFEIKPFNERPWWLKFGFTVLAFFTGNDYSNYYQGIGKNIYLGANWNLLTNYAKYYMLVHERQHLLQFKKYSTPLMAFLYLFFPFPIGLAYFRWKFEREANLEVIKRKVLFGEEVSSQRVKEKYLNIACGSTYLYPWPFKKYISKCAEEDSEIGTKKMTACIQ